MPFPTTIDPALPVPIVREGISTPGDPVIATLARAYAIFDHVIDDLKVENVVVEDEMDFYWSVPSDGLCAVTKDQGVLDIGRLSDDWDFLQPIPTAKGQAVALMLRTYLIIPHEPRYAANRIDARRSSQPHSCSMGKTSNAAANDLRHNP